MEYVLSFFGLPARSWQSFDSAFLSAYWHLRDHFLPHQRNNYHPHILGHRSLALLSALLVSIKIFSLGLVTFGPVESAFSSAITEQNIISLTNSSRESFSLKPLSQNSLLDQAAQTKANDMLNKGYFSHTTPDGKSPWDFITAAGYNYISAGENLAVNFIEAEDVENAWMNSPGHKANILNQNYTQIGIGISQGQYQGKNAIFVVQMFGLPAEQKVILDDKPTVVAPSLDAGALNKTDTQVKVPVPAHAQAKAQEVKGINTPIANLSKIQSKFETKADLQINQTAFNQADGQLNLTAQFLGEPVKVLAKYGKAAVMLLPKGDGSWSGSIKLSELVKNSTNLTLEAQSMSGEKVSTNIGNFAGSTQENFNVVPSSVEQNSQVSFMGKVFHPKNFEQQFYLIFIAVLISCLILAIAIKRHVQHLPLIANTSFVIILAVGLWLR